VDNPFHPRFEQLPAELPIFPLNGVLLLPGQELPLNIFEPRYLNMVTDALGADRNIGMIQPLAARAPEEPLPLRPVGCLGRITVFNEADGGRFLIKLTGVCRFEVDRELEPRRGYRRIAPAWGRYAEDLAAPSDPGLDVDGLQASLVGYFRRQGLEVDWDSLRAMPPPCLLDFLAVHLPFSTDEKQALLESPGHRERARLLTALAESALSAGSGGGANATRH
jgi:uncharacterized protein